MGATRQRTRAFQTLVACVDSSRILEVLHCAPKVASQRALIDAFVAAEIKLFESA